MLAKLMRHVKKVIGLITIEVDMWSDRMTILYWLPSKRTLSQVVRNRVQAMNILVGWKWHYVSTSRNSRDLGTRGVSPAKLGTIWFKEPNSLAERRCWPKEPEIVERERDGTGRENSKQKGVCTYWKGTAQN